MDYLYWKMIRTFLIKGEYQLIQISQAQNEIWLEATRKNIPKFIRILRYDLNWSNWIERDLEITSQNVENISKKYRGRSFEVLNIYVSKHEPVDDWTYRLEKPLLINKNPLHSLLIHSDNFNEALLLVSKHVGIEFDGDLPQEEQPEELESLKQEVLSVATTRIRQEQKLFNQSKPIITYLLIAIQVIMFFLLEINGGSTNTNTLIKFGAKENIAILNGEWWRFFTPIILHIGIFHLLMNTLALFYIGTAVERIFGRSRFLLIYLIAGFFGSLASFVFSSNVSAGASGAIFGCFGALLFFGAVYPNLFIRTIGGNIISVVILNLVFGFVVPGIDNAGHIGGLIGGFLATSIVHLPNHKHYMKRLFGLIVTVVAVFGLFFVGYSIQPFSTDPAFALSLAQEQIEDKDFEKAYETLQNSINKNENSAELYFYLSYVEINLGEFEKAKDHLVNSTTLNPSIPEAYFNLALVYIELNELDLAKEAINNAINIDSNNQSYQQILAEIEQMISTSQ